MLRRRRVQPLRGHARCDDVLLHTSDGHPHAQKVQLKNGDVVMDAKRDVDVGNYHLVARVKEDEKSTCTSDMSMPIWRRCRLQPTGTWTRCSWVDSRKKPCCGFAALGFNCEILGFVSTEVCLELVKVHASTSRTQWPRSFPSIPRPSTTSTGPFARSPVDNHKRPFVIGEFNCSCLGLAGFLNVCGKDIKELKDEDKDLGDPHCECLDVSASSATSTAKQFGPPLASGACMRWQSLWIPSTS